MDRLRREARRRRRNQDPIFLGPEQDTTSWDPPAENSGGGVASSSFAQGFVAPVGTTTTGEAMERHATVDLFREMNAVTEKFARSHRRVQGLDQRGEPIAHLIAAIAQEIVGDTWDIGSSVRSALGLDRWDRNAELEQLVDRAHQLRKRINQSRDIEVDRDACLGSRLEARRQEPWKSSVPDAPIRFLVFPGLSSRGHVLVKQQVYTMSLREARTHNAD